MSQSKEELLNGIKEIIKNHSDVDVSTIKEDSKLNEDIGLDSLDFVELIMALEEKYEIEIPTQDAEKIDTVKGTLDIIMAQLAKK
jgi:acyl carrier protein